MIKLANAYVRTYSDMTKKTVIKLIELNLKAKVIADVKELS